MQQTTNFLYARKSSEDEERQVQSIGDQAKWLNEKASQSGVKFNSDHIFTEAKSAKQPNNRPVFAEMMAKIQNLENPVKLWAWDISRLSRNPIDSALVQWLLQEGKIISIQTHTREYLPGDNALLFSVESGMANQFIIDLRANTKRGIQSKLAKGWKPGLAPVGYMNDKYGEKGNKKILPDPKRFDIVRKVWDLMLTGNYNPRQIHDIAANQWHLTTMRRKTKRGRIAKPQPISHNGVYRVLTNIFYAGVIEYDGQAYKGSHVAMVTMKEFERVQKLLGEKGKPQPQSHEFSYTGNIFCGDCGCQITAETKTKLIKKTGDYKDYTYYRCTRRKTGVPCSQKPIRIADLESQMDAELSRFTILPIFREWALEKLSKVNDKEITDRTKIQAALIEDLSETQLQLDNLTKMRYKDMIDDSEFKREKKALQAHLVKLQTERDENEGRARNWIELTEKTFDFACYARKAFLFGDVRTKREIFAAIGNKAILKDGKLVIKPHEWFQPLINSYSEVEAEYEYVRTKSFGSIKEQTAAFATVRSHWGE